MTALRSTGPCSLALGPPWRDRCSRPLTILAARNVWRSIFSSSFVRLIRRVGALQQHLREAGDAGERRVDLVGDAGGQQADGRHLLGHLQLLFELDAGRDVFEDQHRAGDVELAVAVLAQRHDGDVEQQPVVGRAMRDQRDPRQRRAVGRITQGPGHGFHETRVEDVTEPAAHGGCGRHTVELFERAVPPEDASVRIGDDQPVVERLQHVVAELAQAIEFFGLHVELAVQTAVLERGGDLSGHRSQQRRVLTAQRLRAVSTPQREDGDGAVVGDAGHEVEQPPVSPELDLVIGKPTRGQRVVQRDDVPGLETAAQS